MFHPPSLVGVLFITPLQFFAFICALKKTISHNKEHDPNAYVRSHLHSNPNINGGRFQLHLFFVRYDTTCGYVVLGGLLCRPTFSRISIRAKAMYESPLLRWTVDKQQATNGIKSSFVGIVGQSISPGSTPTLSINCVSAWSTVCFDQQKNGRKNKSVTELSRMASPHISIYRSGCVPNSCWGIWLFTGAPE